MIHSARLARSVHSCKLVAMPRQSPSSPSNPAAACAALVALAALALSTGAGGLTTLASAGDAPSGAGATGISVVAPQNGAFFAVTRVGVAVDAPASVTRVVIARGSAREALARRVDPRSFFCGSIDLEPGPNLLRVLAYEGEEVSSQRAIWVYCEPDRIQAAKTPEGFQALAFHRAENEGRCAPCHAFTYEAGAAQAPPPMPPSKPGAERLRGRAADAIPGPCRTCHAGVLEGAFVHGPAGLGFCRACHPDGTSPRFATPEPVARLCYGCHEHLREGMSRDPYQHGPTAAGRCTLCHSPHASPHLFQTRKHIFDLCTTCHAEKADGRHVIYAFSDPRATHPMRGRKELLRKDRELVCSGCHNPHYSTSQKLWRYPAARRDQLCQYCHRK